METQLMQGDCLEVMKDFESNSIDAIITDPPYGLSAARNSGKKSKGGKEAEGPNGTMLYFTLEELRRELDNEQIGSERK